MKKLFFMCFCKKIKNFFRVFQRFALDFFPKVRYITNVVFQHLGPFRIRLDVPSADRMPRMIVCLVNHRSTQQLRTKSTHSPLDGDVLFLTNTREEGASSVLAQGSDPSVRVRDSRWGSLNTVCLPTQCKDAKQ